MKTILIAFLIGFSAAIIDVVPMILRRIDKYACISAFVQWLVLGFVIPFVGWDMQPWLKGLVIGEMTALPIMVLVFAKEPKSILPILLFSAILGAGVGIAGGLFIH